jgi:putative ABC transport system permease protein
MRLLLDILAQTLRTLWAHKLRSFLTMFGIAWGVGSLLLLVGLGEGFRSGNRKELESIGPDIMFMFGGRIPAVPGSASSMRPFQLTYQDYLSVREEAREVRAVAPVLARMDIRAVTDYTSANGQVFGVPEHYAKIRYLPLESGRWLNQRDDDERRRVAIIGEEMRRNMFPGRPALGASVLLNGVRFEVVGVLKRLGQEDNNATNIRIFVPFNTMREYFPMKEDGAYDAITYLNFQPRSRENHDATKWEVRRIVARNHGFDYGVEDAWFDWDTIQSQKTIGKIFDAMNLFLGSVGIITLALGAIGIINIMLVSVSERTKEIGLRKALGATNRTILTQFFLEGAFLTIVSGFVGLAVAAGLMSVLATLPSPEGFDTPRIVPWSAALAIGLLSFAGVVAGLYPARQAAMLPPVEALRQES